MIRRQWFARSLGAGTAALLVPNSVMAFGKKHRCCNPCGPRPKVIGYVDIDTPGSGCSYRHGYHTSLTGMPTKIYVHGTFSTLSPDPINYIKLVLYVTWPATQPGLGSNASPPAGDYSVALDNVTSPWSTYDLQAGTPDATYPKPYFLGAYASTDHGSTWVDHVWRTFWLKKGT